MNIPSYLGRGRMARYLSVSETYVGMLAIPPDALIDDRPAWTEATAARVKAARETRVRERAERRGNVAA